MNQYAIFLIWYQNNNWLNGRRSIKIRVWEWLNIKDFLKGRIREVRSYLEIERYDWIGRIGIVKIILEGY